MELLGKYENGNYTVKIYENGTKVRRTDDDDFVPAFAESCDVRITSVCSQGCPWCYEGCTPKGEHADLFGRYGGLINSLHPFTEIAIGGNDLDHPQLDGFLNIMRLKRVIVNVTVSQRQYMANLERLALWKANGLVRGIGVSLETPDAGFVSALKSIDGTVLHVIAGIVTEDDIKALRGNGIRLLILGYKKMKRGERYHKEHSQEIGRNTGYLESILPNITGMFAAVSFDNLALDQLCVREVAEYTDWAMSYMGDDGEYTFYMDLVKGEYARSSTARTRYKIDGKNVDEMFAHIRKLAETRRKRRASK